MSRIIVKNLPKNITEDKLKNLFGTKGAITDVQLKYTKEGVFRQFAFVGYRTNEEAQTAIKYFNNSCIQTRRILVEKCAPLGAEDKPKSWSKYSKDSSSYRKAHGIDEQEKAEREKQRQESKAKKVSKFDEIIGEHKNDPEFIEFMKAHDKNRTLWSNDAEMIENQDKEEVNATNGTHKEDKTPKQNDNEGEGDEEQEDKLAEKPISDMEYMKSLMNKTQTAKAKSTKKEISKANLELFTIKIHNVPYKVKRQEVINFFKPLKPYSVRLPRKVHGFCYVGFKTEKEFSKAMLKSKSFIKGKQVFLSDFTEKNKITKAKTDNTPLPANHAVNSKWKAQEEGIQNEEDISESGKIFFRNLTYTVVEDDLQKLFEKYGPIAEINLPVDAITRQIKGFGTVTFVMPEHAVQAFSELDGSTFHGRLLHLIPGKSHQREDEDETEAGLSFQEKKELRLKKAAQQPYNWNTLLLGSNAVADILARQFETSKENILDSKRGGSSAAVRLALGETQMVIEMKRFLEENDVCLNVFDAPNAKRSKTVILVKNLPADTQVSDLQPLFSEFGPLARLVLPPSGVTALIEYMDPSEAKRAFKKLAYSKFKHVPLYLEWAPEGTFKKSSSLIIPKKEKQPEEVVKEETIELESEQKTKKQKKKEDKQRKEKERELMRLEEENRRKEEEEEKAKKKEPVPQDDQDDDDVPPEENATLFLRNLNFKTREDVIRNHFAHLGPIHIVQVAMRKDPENPKNKISLGYGFIQFKRKETAEKALKQMQFTQIEGNQVELKRSDRTLKTDEKAALARKMAKNTKQSGTKIMVRNIPFQATSNEVRDIFKAFGEIRTVRLPLKMAPGEESHRGFGFVDFLSKSDAKKAFEALSQSTHLYGRRLGLEWASTTENDITELRKRTAQSFQQSDGPTKKSKKGLFDTSEIAADNDDKDDDGDF